MRFFRFLFISLFPFCVLAQDTPADLRPVSRTFALTHAKIVQSPEKVIENGTVLIRDGYILEVGSNVRLPFDAVEIKCDSMTVYAGFIDGLSKVGIPKPKDEKLAPKVPEPGYPTYERAGATPFRQAAMLLDAADSGIGDLRKQGFTMAHTTPYGQMLPGSGALISLGERNHLYRAGISQLGQMLGSAAGEGGQRTYPSNQLGIMAQFRQVFLDAKRQQTHEQNYARNPLGIERPQPNTVLSALYPLINGQQSLYFIADDDLVARRALRIAQDTGVKVALVGLKNGYMATDFLKSANVPLWLSLNLPDAPKNDAKKDSTINLAQVRTEDYTQINSEAAVLNARRDSTYKQYLRNAGILHQNGLRFGFSTLNASASKIRDNLRTMVENGLPESVALAALTTNPAQMLGIENVMGTVEKGKMANLVVTANGGYFEKKGAVKYVFVDGVKFEYEVPKPSATSSAKKDSTTTVSDGAKEKIVLGTWTYTVSVPGGSQEGKLRFYMDGDVLKCTESSNGSDTEGQNVVIEENKVTFDLPVEGDGAQLVIKMVMNIDGESFTGSASVGQFGTFDISGSRTSPD